MDWNQLTLEWVLKQLKWKGEIGYTEVLKAEYPKPEMIDKRRKYAEAPLKDVPYRYAQVFQERHGFVGNLSILDLLFCEGPASRALLEGA